MTIKVLDLFSGIGGFSLGLEQAGGFETVAFSEVDKYACRVLKKNWSNVPNIGDITNATFPKADLITAGFPCQDISLSGKGAGLSGTRSGLFWEVVRAIRLVEPSFVLLENVAALRFRGLGDVLGGLAQIGYDAEWGGISAADVGGKHIRNRMWILAYPYGQRWEFLNSPAVGSAAQSTWLHPASSGSFGPYWPTAQSPILRGTDDVPYRVDRIRCLGNAIIPKIATQIGKQIAATLSVAID